MRWLLQKQYHVVPDRESIRGIPTELLNLISGRYAEVQSHYPTTAQWMGCPWNAFQPQNFQHFHGLCTGQNVGKLALQIFVGNSPDH